MSPKRITTVRFPMFSCALHQSGCTPYPQLIAEKQFRFTTVTGVDPETELAQIVTTLAFTIILSIAIVYENTTSFYGAHDLSLGLLVAAPLILMAFAVFLSRKRDFESFPNGEYKAPAKEYVYTKTYEPIYDPILVRRSSIQKIDDRYSSFVTIPEGVLLVVQDSLARGSEINTRVGSRSRNETSFRSPLPESQFRPSGNPNEPRVHARAGAPGSSAEDPLKKSGVEVNAGAGVRS